MIEFDWDDANIQHIALHDISIDEVESVLNGFTIELETQDGYDEERFSEIGVTRRVATWCCNNNAKDPHSPSYCVRCP